MSQSSVENQMYEAALGVAEKSGYSFRTKQQRDKFIRDFANQVDLAICTVRGVMP